MPLPSPSAAASAAGLKRSQHAFNTYITSPRAVQNPSDPPTHTLAHLNAWAARARASGAAAQTARRCILCAAAELAARLLRGGRVSGAAGSIAPRGAIRVPAGARPATAADDCDFRREEREEAGRRRRRSTLPSPPQPTTTHTHTRLLPIPGSQERGAESRAELRLRKRAAAAAEKEEGGSGSGGGGDSNPAKSATNAD